MMIAENKAITRRLKIASGQVEGVVKMIEEGRYCIDISNQIMAAIAALKGINRDILSNHLHHCVADSARSSDEQALEEKLQEINQIIRKLSK